MTFEELKAFVARVRYKPGYRLLCEREPGQDVVWLRLAAYQPDVNGGPEGRFVSIARYTDWDLGQWDDFVALNCIRELIRNYELHEMDEWIRLDDERPFDPHA